MDLSFARADWQKTSSSLIDRRYCKRRRDAGRRGGGGGRWGVVVDGEGLKVGVVDESLRVLAIFTLLNTLF